MQTRLQIRAHGNNGVVWCGVLRHGAAWCVCKVSPPPPPFSLSFAPHRHAVADLVQDGVCLDELGGEELDAPGVEGLGGGVPRGGGGGPVGHGLGHLDGEEEREEVADAETPAAGPGGGGAAALALDELEEGCLGAGFPLQNAGGKDLHEHVAALHVHQNLVPHQPRRRPGVAGGRGGFGCSSMLGDAAGRQG